MVKEIPQVQIKPPAKNEVKNANENLEQMKARVMNAALLEVRDQAEKIKRHLQTEIQDGFVTVETHGLQITLRIEEKGSFTSGSAVLKPGFESVMDKITDSLQRAKGIIRVAGHTDDIPITTDSYRSNWELSSSRAVSVAHYMLTHKGLEPGRIAIEGYADTKPLLPNTSTENRAKNRRVEVTLIQDDPTLALERKKLLGAD
jgi:chemotaxis protein MotB